MNADKTPPMLHEEWKRYRDTVYPQGVPAGQNKELHQAFFAGAVVITTLLKASHKLPEELAVKFLEGLCDEADQVCKHIADASGGRN